MATISIDSLAGYILEELIAYLIRNTGYRLLVDERTIRVSNCQAEFGFDQLNTCSDASL